MEDMEIKADTKKEQEYEIVQHTAMNNLELFLVEMVSRNPHGHSDLEIGVLLEGSVELILEDKRIMLKKNDIYVINRYQVHSFLNSKGRNLILAFQVHAEFYKSLCPRLTRIQFENLIESTNPLYPQLLPVLSACAEAYFFEADYFELKCASLLLEALYLLAQSKGSSWRSEKEYAMNRSSTLRLNRITDYIAEHYADKLSLEDIARLEHITTFHASHFIRKMLGIPFQEYVSSLRFEHAYRLITQTSLNITDICMETGFSSSRYLNQIFKKRLGMTATDFRRLGKAAPILPPALPTDNLQRRLSIKESRKFFKIFE